VIVTCACPWADLANKQHTNKTKKENRRIDRQEEAGMGVSFLQGSAEPKRESIKFGAISLKKRFFAGGRGRLQKLGMAWDLGVSF
jgi:hypothetical protein